jgi:Lrp/AsnC family leucine-responsive transcriptional regulator
MKENNQLDKKDKKILYHLDLDSRQTLSQLSKKVGLSKQVIDYRIKNLINKKIITQFYTVINISKLGYTHYKLYLKLQNTNIEKEKEITDYWIKSKNSVWVASCRGRWDISISILAKDINELGNIITNFTNKYSNFILEKNILITQTSPVFTKTYLAEQKEKKEFIYTGKIENYELNKTEKEILSILSNNARIPILDLMEKTKLTRDVINYRIKKLTKDNIISQYRVLIDPNKTGYLLHKIILRLKNLSQEKEKEFKHFVKQHPNGVQFLKLLGNWDIELEFETKSEEQLHQILLEIRNKFSDTVRDYDTLLIYKEHKLNYFPF